MDDAATTPDDATREAPGTEQPDREQPDREQPDHRPANVGQPGKVMRIGTMIRHLLEEVRSAPLDESARERLVAIHEASVHELESALSPELAEELRRISLPFTDDGATPTDAELRIAQAQLVGWLEGLFHGLQAAMAAQQLAAQQAQAASRGLPPGAAARPGTSGAPGSPGATPPSEDQRPTPGQYL